MEIVAPAGNFEKLTYALAYGADACYLAWENYGLRAFADNFSLEELKQACLYAHARKKKIYLTLNIFARNNDINELPVFLKSIADIGLDAIIVSEPGTFSLVKQYTSIPIHISTQANTTNWQAVKFWHDLGAKRIILAREVSYSEMLEIKTRVPDAELEVFIHGAMCMAWSGRCLMSALLNDRSGNQGQCTHPCRWEWNLTEPTREGQEFSIEEDNRGSYLMFSKDLCLLREVPLLAFAGIHSGKIEGRMKSMYYTALMSRIYKEAVQLDIHDTPAWQNLSGEVNKVNHRPYFSGFFYAEPDTNLPGLPDFELDREYQEWQYCGKISHCAEGLVWFDCLSKIETGDVVQLIYPDRKDDISFIADVMYDRDNLAVQMTKPNQPFGFPVNTQLAEFGLVRKLIKTSLPQIPNAVKIEVR